MASAWDELGIPPTADEGVIRRAYAAGLKSGRGPNDDPAAFARLRAAYEDALHRARNVEEDEGEIGDIGSAWPDRPPERDPDAKPEQHPNQAAWNEANAFMAHLRHCLDARDGPAAAAALQAWVRSDPARPLAVSEVVEGDLFELLDEPGTPPEVLAALGDAYGQDFGYFSFAVRHPVLNGLLPARVAAALWWRGVQRIAASGAADAAPGHPSRVAAALLGPPGGIPRRVHRDWKHHPLLRELLAEAGPHVEHLRGSVDPATLAQLRAALDGMRWFGTFLARPVELLHAAVPWFLFGCALLAGIMAVDAAMAGRTGRFPPPSREVQELESTVGQRVALRQFGPDTLIYFTNLLTCRGALTRIRYGVDTPLPNRDFPLWRPDPSAPVCGPMPHNALLYATVPGTVAFVSVEVTWADGVTSGVKLVHHETGRPELKPVSPAPYPPARPR